MVVEASPEASNKPPVFKRVLIGFVAAVFLFTAFGYVSRASKSPEQRAYDDCMRSARNATTADGQAATLAMCEGLRQVWREKLLASK